MIEDWSAAYDNSAREVDAPAIFADWAARGAAFREGAAGALLDLPYGGHPRERLDLFAPAGAPRGLLVFIHGGYWKAMGREASAWLAAGPLARGWAVAVPSYPLCPEVRIRDIGRSVAAAVEEASRRVAGPVALAGHSAGGHLATRLLCADGLLAGPVAARVSHAVSISGVHDLRPLMLTAMNATLAIDEAEALTESPALLRPRAGARLTAWVGAEELAEFRRQNRLIADMWAGLGAETQTVEAQGRRHFNVVSPLAEPSSALTRRVTEG